MKILSKNSTRESQALESLLSSARLYGRKRGLECELSNLICIFRSLWNAMSEDGKIMSHQSDTVTSYVFDFDADPGGRLYLTSADAYYQLIHENREEREEDASGPEWGVGDMEEMIATAWDCLGATERGKALAESDLASLIESYIRPS